jgi:hypothetical protein
MITQLRKYWDNEPLVLIMGLAILVRLLAVIFARGWGMIDDHFIVVESSQSWVDGHDYNYWLPGSPGNSGPTGHNMFYPGIHFILLSILKWLGINDPNTKMYIIRFLHGLLSLITVWLGYRITETMDGKKSARIVGILLAVLWFMPWASVRNLVEMTSVPFLMAGFWFIIRKNNLQSELLSYFLAGLFLGIAFNIRPQTALFSIGAGLVVLIWRKWKDLLFLTAGAMLPVLLIQGGIDYALWGYPFAEMIEYLNVCFTTSSEYISLPWYNYFLVILGALIPPVGFFLLFGFVRKWKTCLIIVLPTLLFFLFHSYFPNKQERFIMPMMPFFIIAGTIGWQEFAASSGFWKKHVKLLRASWTFFWILNSFLLLILTFSYSKRARAESMLYLSKYPDISYLLVIDEEGNPEMMPRFYLGQWPVSWSEQSGDHSPDSLLVHAARQPANEYPRFILFTGERKLQTLVTKTRKYFPFIVFEKTVRPGFIDRTMHWLNPMNRNRTIYIYRNKEFYPEKKN